MGTNGKLESGGTSYSSTYSISIEKTGVSIDFEDPVHGTQESHGRLNSGSLTLSTYNAYAGFLQDYNMSIGPRSIQRTITDSAEGGVEHSDYAI